jgi:hypothetical protein
LDVELEQHIEDVPRSFRAANKQVDDLPSTVIKHKKYWKAAGDTNNKDTFLLVFDKIVKTIVLPNKLHTGQTSYQKI